MKKKWCWAALVLSIGVGTILWMSTMKSKERDRVASSETAQEVVLEGQAGEMKMIDLGSTMRPEEVAAEYQSIVNSIEAYAGEAMRSERDNFVELLLDEDYADRGISVDEVTTGTPFFYFNPDKETQNTAVHYPLYVGQELIGIMNMIYANEVWQCSVEGKTEQEQMLEKMQYGKQPIIFYVCGQGECGDVVMAEAKDQTWNYIEGQGEVATSDRQQQFQQYSYEEKVSYIAHNG